MHRCDKPDMISFSIKGGCPVSAARAGVLETPHGTILTPTFMPVGTVAAVKTLSPLDLRNAGAQIMLGNTYHIYHYPGSEVVRNAGGLASFTAWNGPMLTDSGGFQVFSLSDTRKLTEDGVEFKSVYDGRNIRLTPEEVCRIEREIGADIIYVLDECPPYPCSESEVERATRLSLRWAERFLNKFAEEEINNPTGQSPFVVVQGGVFANLRRMCTEELEKLDPVGYGIGGVSVGEPPAEMARIARLTCDSLPKGKPRHLLGVGTPADLLEGVEAGVDLFDCVIPTRNGRNGQAFTSRGVANLRLKQWVGVDEPLDAECSCEACKIYSMGYLHHLAVTGEMLGMRLLSLHNVTYYESLLMRARQAVTGGDFLAWKRQVSDRWRELDKA